MADGCWGAAESEITLWFLLGGPWKLSLRFGAMMSSVTDSESLQVPEVSIWRYLVGTFYMGLEVEKEDQAQGGSMRHQHGET